jgi:hypothetical protein
VPPSVKLSSADALVGALLKFARYTKSLAHHHHPEYRHAKSMNLPTKCHAQRGISRITVIILVSIGAIILLGLIGIYLFTPRLDLARKRMTESTAMAAIRSVNASQVNYFSSFENIGYAPDLASLGPGPDGKCAASATPAHACMIDAVLGNSACTGTNWCTQAGYKFIIQGICANGKCTDYLVTATPFDTLNGDRNFCSSSDNAIHFETAAPKSAPFSLMECQALPAL